MTTSNPSCITFSTSTGYGAIYANPPWLDRSRSSKGTEHNTVSPHDCLDFRALTALPVARIAAPNCALFLWASDPLLPSAFDLIRAWGFEYKTVAFCWQKLNTTVEEDSDSFIRLDGSPTSTNPELCLLATRGRPRGRAKDVRRTLVELPCECSDKPDCVRGRIESLVSGPYLELFARETKAGWDCWGD